MPYAISFLEDGKFPSARSIAPDEELVEGEVYVEDAPHLMVWDATNKRLRKPTEAEEVERQKPRKRREVQDRIDGEVQRIFPIQGQHASVARRRPNDERVKRADDLLDSLDTLMGRVEAARTHAELEGI